MEGDSGSLGAHCSHSAIKSIVNPSRQQCSSSVVPYTGCVFTVTAPGGLLMLWLSKRRRQERDWRVSRGQVSSDH